ncbi:hypothetical protein [Candidatus Parabeggiatoa sp. HSG14]|uniref:hypothetical protein n=1 Tax=Candidatus Parabeggiatoa sp. HSG14 TaxID=3055593 RepID=UPI0025A6C9FD|nr:hypothetical protein [Thiotrichales bacterium HSG14]
MDNQLENIATQVGMLRKNYAKKLSSHIEKIYYLWETLQNTWQLETLDEFYHELDNLAETSLMFEFNQLSDMTRELEYFIYPFIQLDLQPNDSQSQQVFTFIIELQRVAEQS